MAQTNCADLSPHLLLLRALEGELLGRPSPQADGLGAWAQAVAGHLRQAASDRPLDGQAVLAMADCALRQIMGSANWRFLLEDALRRPDAFTRTLLILLQGHAAPLASGVRQ